MSCTNCKGCCQILPKLSTCGISVKLSSCARTILQCIFEHHEANRPNSFTSKAVHQDFGSPVTVVKYLQHKYIEGFKKLRALHQCWHLIVQQLHQKHSRTLPQLQEKDESSAPGTFPEFQYAFLVGHAAPRQPQYHVVELLACLDTACISCMRDSIC